MTTFSISGSTILSETALLHSLFTPHHDGVEIGLLQDEAAWAYFLRLLGEHPHVAWGLHFPRLRTMKEIQNDLVAAEPAKRSAVARALAEDARRVADAGGAYILVHFPFFPSSEQGLEDVADRIRRGVEMLHQVRSAVGLPLVVEFKLGRHRDPGGIQYVAELGERLVRDLAAFGCCLDVGDWSIAALHDPAVKDAFNMWLARATHLHLHGVALLDDGRYFWTPVGSQAALPGGWDLADIVRRFAAHGGRWAVCEHTPHLVTDEAAVSEGYRWLRRLLADVATTAD